ncbi:helix-turn-helix domain-containing protein [Streptomyces sp. NPDC048508]|uniref:helix-turn-helix domain-containing protein n=1 Tax=Streptomyces sp. NPDC048508 TaxID=3365561 RepID=UPI0037116A9A
MAAVGPRIKGLRTQRTLSLTSLAEATGISLSTLSRLESGQRRPTLELLLPLALSYGWTSANSSALYAPAPRGPPRHRSRRNTVRRTSPQDGPVPGSAGGVVPVRVHRQGPRLPRDPREDRSGPRRRAQRSRQRRHQ